MSAINNDSNPLAALSAASGVNKPSALPAQQLGQNEFFKLLTTQLSSQSPLNPMDNSAFVAQMAQFSTASGIQQMQATMNKMLDASTSNQALQATALVGHRVVAPGNRIDLEAGSNGASAGFKLDAPADAVGILIKDAKGQLVRDLPLGTFDSGMHSLAWDGKDQSGKTLPQGAYFFEVQAMRDGKAQSAESFSYARVQSVLLSQGAAQLELGSGLGTVGLKDVQQII